VRELSTITRLTGFSEGTGISDLAALRRCPQTPPPDDAYASGCFPAFVFAGPDGEPSLGVVSSKALTAPEVACPSAISLWR